MQTEAQEVDVVRDDSGSEVEDDDEGEEADVTSTIAGKVWLGCCIVLNDGWKLCFVSAVSDVEVYFRVLDNVSLQGRSAEADKSVHVYPIYFTQAFSSFFL